MRKLIALFLMLFVALTWAGPEDDLKNADEAFEKTDFTAAFKSYQKLAEQGYVPAQAMVGVMYAVGSGVAQDYAAARKWYQKAAEQGLAEAQIALGMMYFAGHGVGQNYCIAASWYRKAATQGNELAQYLLGSMLYDGLCSKNHKEAIVWLTKAAEQGLPEQYALDVQKKLDLIEAERE